MQFGDITFGRWAEHLTIGRGCLYSRLANNIWFTNLPAIQLGHLRFRFAVTTGTEEFDASAAEALGNTARVGLTVL